RAVDSNRFVHGLRNRPTSVLSVPLGGLAAGPLGIALRLPFRERSGLAFAAAPQFLDELLQLSNPAFLLLDPALLLGDPAPELRILLNDLIVSRHV
ncbi:MAG TPA: hypothetical protein VKK31_13670, partial [Thermoanaerobaculia bacterium]|nr:hypothetical protein [Thermoanaerobaculia bacterium]